jgi:LPS-assembly lipoprotein
MKKHFCPGIIVLAMLLLGACGWQLKGEHPGSQRLGVVLLTGDAINGPVTRAVRTELSNSGVTMAATPGAANYVLWIGAEQSNLRTASYDALVRAAENTLLLQTDYILRNAAGEAVSGPNTVYAERVYEYDVQGVTSSAAQLSIIMRELQEQLAQQIVRRVQAFDPAAANTTEPPGTTIQ